MHVHAGIAELSQKRGLALALIQHGGDVNVVTALTQSSGDAVQYALETADFARRGDVQDREHVSHGHTAALERYPSWRSHATL